MQVVEYTCRVGSCPVGTWDAIRTMGLPKVGGPITQRTHWVRAKLDLDGTVLAIWDWVGRCWIPAADAITAERLRAAI